ncbi:UNVERIFIED_CONTAM: hypothetical protein Sangu_1983700 [Sesamum angustifolium]|uniref:Uncharacterized protein n=1 Tax=Sesamum angustifolium TaxID=2727405 RepID=A0AAW2LWQ6_9LAMI
MADRFSNVVHAADQSLWDSCTKSQLVVVAELVDIKANCHIFERIYDRTSQWANRILPFNHTLSGDYYNTKKLVKDLGLPIEKIHACTSLLEGETNTGRSPNMLSLEELRNVRMGLCTDGFVPHGQYGRTYSCCPVIITQYNLHPVVACGCQNVRPYHGSGFHDAGVVDVDCERPTRLWNDVWVGYCGGLKDVRSVWIIQGHSIYNTVGKRATLTATYSVSLCTTHTEGIRKPSRRILSRNKVARPRLTEEQIYDQVTNISPAVEMSLSLLDGYGSDHKWTKKSIFWDLSYWSTLLMKQP